ncbi:Uncharacterised protein [Vibrio cholerae]|nr:Uncharacterised protein [Vibrio cholerae]
MPIDPLSNHPTALFRRPQNIKSWREVIHTKPLTITAIPCPMQHKIVRHQVSGLIALCIRKSHW